MSDLFKKFFSEVLFILVSVKMNCTLVGNVQHFSS